MADTGAGAGHHGGIPAGPSGGAAGGAGGVLRRHRGASGGVADERAIVIRGFPPTLLLVQRGVASGAAPSSTSAAPATTTPAEGSMLATLLAAMASLGPVLTHSVASDATAVYILFEAPMTALVALSMAHTLPALLSLPAGSLVVERHKADPRTVVATSATIVLKNLAYDLTVDRLREFLNTLPVKPLSVDLHLDAAAPVAPTASPRLRAMATTAGGDVRPTFSGVAFARYASADDVRIVYVGGGGGGGGGQLAYTHHHHTHNIAPPSPPPSLAGAHRHASGARQQLCGAHGEGRVQAREAGGRAHVAAHVTHAAVWQPAARPAVIARRRRRAGAVGHGGSGLYPLPVAAPHSVHRLICRLGRRRRRRARLLLRLHWLWVWQFRPRLWPQLRCHRWLLCNRRCGARGRGAAQGELGGRERGGSTCHFGRRRGADCCRTDASTSGACTGTCACTGSGGGGIGACTAPPAAGCGTWHPYRVLLPGSGARC